MHNNQNLVVIQKDADNVVRVDFIISNEYPVEELASVVVPEGQPFLIANQNDIPRIPFHNAIDPDFSNPDGISIGPDKIRAKWAAEKKAAEEAESARINAAVAEESERRINAAKAAALRAIAEDSVEGA